MTRYRVVGAHEVYGHKPGTTFAADLSEFDERRLLRGGHLAVVLVEKPKGSRRGVQGSD